MTPGEWIWSHSRHKAIIVKNVDDDTSDHPYSHALVAGMTAIPEK